MCKCINFLHLWARIPSSRDIFILSSLIEYQIVKIVLTIWYSWAQCPAGNFPLAPPLTMTRYQYAVVQMIPKLKLFRPSSHVGYALIRLSRYGIFCRCCERSQGHSRPLAMRCLDSFWEIRNTQKINNMVCLLYTSPSPRDS